MITFKQSLSVLPSMNIAYELFRRCEAFDRKMPKIYWQALRERQQDLQAFDYLCFSDDQLVGMLNVLFFSETAEFTVLIDPDFRGQKIAQKLVKIALIKLRNYVVSDYLLISPYPTCTRAGGTWHHNEIEMRAPDRVFVQNSQTPQVLNLVQARVEHQADINTLASIHIEAFEKPDYQAMQARFSSSLTEPNRKAYIAYNQDQQAVAKLHVREDFNRIYIHDVGVKKAFRQRGYGKALMLTWLKNHQDTYQKPIAVEVLGDNTAALKLYESCGYTQTNMYYFFRFPLVKF